MERMMERAGSCGLYQAFHIIFTQLPRFVTPWAVFLMLLAGYNPGWRCANDSNSNFSTTLKRIIPPQSQSPLGVSPSTTTDRSIRYSNSSDITSHNSTQTDGSDYDGTCDQFDRCKNVQFRPDSITLVTDFQLLCGKSWTMTVILVICGVGGLPGSFIAGHIGEKYGRRKGLYSFTFLMGVSSGLAIFSPHWSMYAVCSFFINFGVHGTITLANVFTMEFLNSKWRGYFGAIPVWPLSFFIFTFTIRYLRNWIYLHLVTLVLSLTACIGFFLLPESPRWLMVHGKPEEAKDAIRKMARMNRAPDPIFDDQETIQFENYADSGRSEKKRYSYLDLFRTRQLCIYSIKFFVVMTSFSMCYLGISFGLQALPGDFYTNIVVSACCDILFPLLYSPLANRLGRRWAAAAVTSFGSLCCLSVVLIILISGRIEHPIAIKACAFVAKSGSHGVFMLGQLCAVELYPTAVRNLALGMTKVGTCLGALLAPFIIPSQSDSSFVITFSFSCFCFLVDLFVFLSLPETKNQCLEDRLPDTTISIPATSCDDGEKKGKEGEKGSCSLPQELNLIKLEKGENEKVSTSVNE